MKKNLRTIERIVNSTLATSLAEVAKASELSEFYVKFLLVIHPKRKKKIMNQLNQNRKHKKQNVLGLVDEQDFNIKPNSKFVIDASICGYGKKLDDIIQKIFDSNSMIVLTSITIKVDLCQVFRHIFLRIFIHFFKLRLRNCYKY